MMNNPIFPIASYLFSFITTALLIWLLRPLALRIKLIDEPGGRKKHAEPTPLVGGVAMAMGFAFGLLTLYVSLEQYRSFLAAVLLLVIVGVLDDFHELSARARLGAQVLAGLLMTVWGGVTVLHLGNLFFAGNLALGGWGVPFTVIATIGMINAINMLDGVDGLTGGVVASALLCLSVLAYHDNRFTDMHILFLTIFCIVSFLLFNLKLPSRSQALVFMGDAGSMFLGFVLVWFLVRLSQGSNRAADPTTMLWIVAIPLFDMVSVVLRRIYRGQSPFIADRYHIHHLLHRLGYSSLQIVLLLSAATLVCGAIGIVGFWYHINDTLMFILFLVLFIAFFVICMRIWRQIEQCPEEA